MKEIIFIINDCIKNGIFPDDLKLADVASIFETEDSFKKENYRPVIILLHMSKDFERILYKQIDTFMAIKFSPYLCSFRKNHNAQYSLLKMIETWKKHLDKGEKIGVILMDLSKGPLLFNIFLNDIFMFISKCNLCNYADDNTLYSTGKDLNRIRRNLEMDFMILHQWFHENHMTLNPGKCHYMVIGSGDLSHEIMLNNNKITSSNEEKLLGIFLDSKLNFESHITSLCRKAGQKINALARLKNYLTLDQRNLLLNSIIKS